MEPRTSHPVFAYWWFARTCTTVLGLTLLALLAIGCKEKGNPEDTAVGNPLAPTTVTSAPTPAPTTPAPAPTPTPTPVPPPTPTPVPVPRPATCSIVTSLCSLGGTFGAIAYSPGGRYAWSNNYSSRSGAEARAVQECGASDCKVITWFQNQCGALARSRNGVWGGLGGSRPEAEASALSRCDGESQQGPTLAQPSCVRNGTSTTNVPIANTTRYTVQVTFEGPVTRVATIIGGATQTLVLPPGTYRVTGQVSASNVDFVPSTWTITSGCSYPLEIVSM